MYVCNVRMYVRMPVAILARARGGHPGSRGGDARPWTPALPNLSNQESLNLEFESNKFLNKGGGLS